MKWSYQEQEVRRLDREFYEKVDVQNPQRLMWALEVCSGTGQTFFLSSQLKVQRPFEILKIELYRVREEPYRRTDQRMDLMISKGLFEQAEKLFPSRQLNSLQTVGYQEILAYWREIMIEMRRLDFSSEIPDAMPKDK